MQATDQTEQNRPVAHQIVMVAEKVTKRFPGTVALDQVDFNVYAGAVNVLIGENGAGKSTLMKILAGVEQPTSGRLLLDGSPVEFKIGLKMIPTYFFRQTKFPSLGLAARDRSFPGQ